MLIFGFGPCFYRAFLYRLRRRTHRFAHFHIYPCMTWNDVTLSHYQQLYPTITDPSLDHWEKDMEIVRVLNNMTHKELEELPFHDYRELRKDISFIYQVPQGGQPKYLQGKKRRYKVIYDIQKMPFARYAEAKTFAGSTEAEFVKNMNMLVASMVMPMKKRFGVWKPDVYDSERHSEYADDLLDASFQDVYQASVFFYQLFTLLIHSLKGYMVENLMTANLTKAQAEGVHEALCSSLDGFTTANKLPTLKASVWKRLGISQPCAPSTPSHT
jgi:hypothetical protein